MGDIHYSYKKSSDGKDESYDFDVKQDKVLHTLGKVEVNSSFPQAKSTHNVDEMKNQFENGTVLSNNQDIEKELTSAKGESKLHSPIKSETQPNTPKTLSSPDNYQKDENFFSLNMKGSDSLFPFESDLLEGNSKDSLGQDDNLVSRLEQVGRMAAVEDGILSSDIKDKMHSITPKPSVTVPPEEASKEKSGTKVSNVAIKTTGQKNKMTSNSNNSHISSSPESQNVNAKDNTSLPFNGKSKSNDNRNSTAEYFPNKNNRNVLNMNSTLEKPKLRRGKWTPEEEAYANRLIIEFKAGLLPLTDGTTLRTFLSKLLNCDPMRISKKFVGGNCIGKQVFRRRQGDIDRLTVQEMERSRHELAELERKFLDRVSQTNRSKSTGQIGRRNHSLGPVAPDIIRHHLSAKANMSMNLNGKVDQNKLFDLGRANNLGLNFGGNPLNFDSGYDFKLPNFGDGTFGNAAPMIGKLINDGDFNMNMSGHQFPNLSLPFHPLNTSLSTLGTSEHEALEQGFNNLGEFKKLNHRMNPNMTAAWMLPPGPSATSTLNVDFGSSILKDTIEKTFNHNNLNDKFHENQEESPLTYLPGNYEGIGDIQAPNNKFPFTGINQSKSKTTGKNLKQKSNFKFAEEEGGSRDDEKFKKKALKKSGNDEYGNSLLNRNEIPESKDGNALPWSIINKSHANSSVEEHGYTPNFLLYSPVVNGTQQNMDSNIPSIAPILSNFPKTNAFDGIIQQPNTPSLSSENAKFGALNPRYLQMQGRVTSDANSFHGRPRSFTNESMHSINSNFVTTYSPRMVPQVPSRNISGQDTALSISGHSMLPDIGSTTNHLFNSNTTSFPGGGPGLFPSSSGHHLSIGPSTPKLTSTSSQNLSRVDSASNFFAFSPNASSENLRELEQRYKNPQIPQSHSHGPAKNARPGLPKPPTTPSLPPRHGFTSHDKTLSMGLHAESNLNNVMDKTKHDPNIHKSMTSDCDKQQKVSMTDDHNASEKEKVKAGNGLKRVYSDSNCSYDSENVSSYDGNSNCISVSSGSSGSQLKPKGTSIGDASDFVGGGNANGLHNLHAVATECDELLNYTHVQKKHKAL